MHISIHGNNWRKYLRDPSVGRFEDVDIVYWGETDEDLERAFRLATRRVVVNGQQTIFPMRKICEALRGSSIEELHLIDCEIHDAHIFILARILPTMPNLWHLDLSYNWINDAGATRLAGVIRQCPRLNYISLMTCHRLIETQRDIVDALNARRTFTLPQFECLFDPDTERAYQFGRRLRENGVRILAMYGRGRTPAQIWAEWKDGDHAMMSRVLLMLI